MKRKLSFLLLLAVALLMWLVPVRAEANEVTGSVEAQAVAADVRASGTTDTGVEWTLYYDGTLEITGQGDMYTSYGSPWNQNRQYVRKVTISNGITSIGNSAFSGCEALRSVEMPDSVLTIGSSAFWGCKTMPSIKLSKNLTSIGDQAFYNCNALSAIELPNKLESIGYSCFAYCSSLASIRIPDSVTELDEFAFNNCTSLVTAELSANITSVEKATFQSCSNLQSIQIPSGVTNIGSYAFNGCANLKTLTLPDSLYSIEDHAFTGNKLLKQVTLPNALTYLGSYAFSNCESLEKITLPENLGVIEDYTFNGCVKLTGINLPKNLYGIGDKAFNGSGLTSVTIPNGVTSIGNSAFAYTDIANVTLPNAITTIPNGLFYYCDKLTQVVIPDSVVTVEDSAFYFCDELTTVVFGTNVRSIGYSAFNGCNKLSTLHFLGDAPAMQSSTFSPFLYNYTNITAYYPTNNSTWTDEVKAGNYGRTITWVGSSVSWLGNVEIYEVNAHVTGNILRWNAVKNADIYQIYRMRSGDSGWTLLKNTRSLAYKDASAEVGVKYYYKVIARNGDIKSDIKTATSVFAVRPMQNVTVTKAVGHETGNILYWDAVDGAKLYQVYRLNSGKWELLKNTGSLAYKDETAPVGVKSYYKIVARNGSAMSSIATTASVGVLRPAGAVTKLDNVTVYKTTGHSTGNILYWNAVDGAKIYQVYRLVDGEWVLLKNTGSLAYKDEAAPVGVASYYKIVARNGDVKSDIKTTTSTRVVRAK